MNQAVCGQIRDKRGSKRKCRTETFAHAGLPEGRMIFINSSRLSSLTGFT
jgi:hypothetical protein